MERAIDVDGRTVAFEQSEDRGRVASRLLVCTVAFGAAACLLPLASPAAALAMGVGLALTIGNPWLASTRVISKWTLQASIVLLGFGTHLPTMLHAARTGALLAAGSIAVTLALGAILGRLLGVRFGASRLVSAGTAICGGSAIAAVAAATDAEEADVGVAMGTVFVLNAAALLVFPIVGHAIGLSPTEFGTWSGMAIHDVSSVVGAAARYGDGALAQATAVKLSRSLWIVPVAIGFAWWRRRSSEGAATRIHVPWFIGLFVLASAVRSALPIVAAATPVLSRAAAIGMAVSLFLIGAGLDRKTLKSVGWRTFTQGLILWLLVAAGCLGVVLLGHF